MNVFISYSHRDEEIAKKLAIILEKSNFEVFIDNKIPIGGDIYREIGKNIIKSDAVVVIVSKNSTNSFAVANETISYLSFLNKGKMPLIIPIVIGKDVEIPYYLRDYNCLQIQTEEKIENSFEQVVAILKFHEQKLLVLC